MPAYPCLVSQSICLTNTCEPPSYSARRTVIGASGAMRGRSGIASSSRLYSSQPRSLHKTTSTRTYLVHLKILDRCQRLEIYAATRALVPRGLTLAVVEPVVHSPLLAAYCGGPSSSTSGKPVVFIFADPSVSAWQCDTPQPPHTRFRRHGCRIPRDFFCHIIQECTTR